jgi:hypothetical protein
LRPALQRSLRHQPRWGQGPTGPRSWRRPPPRLPLDHAPALQHRSARCGRRLRRDAERSQMAETRSETPISSLGLHMRRAMHKRICSSLPPHRRGRLFCIGVSAQLPAHCSKACKYPDRNSCMIFPGSAGVSPAPEAARMAALPGYKRSEHNGSKILSRYLQVHRRTTSAIKTSKQLLRCSSVPMVCKKRSPCAIGLPCVSAGTRKTSS